MEKTSFENMSFYDSLSVPEASAVKPISGGKLGSLKFSNINTQWRLKRLTEVFGPYGKGWYIDGVEHSVESSTMSPETKALVELQLHVKYPGDNTFCEPVFGIGGAGRVMLTNSGDAKFSDDCYKCAYSDAVSVAGRFLGLASSVYMNRFKNTNAYVLNEQNPNLEFYKKLECPETDVVKEITGGNLKGLSSINTQWRYERLTKVFGPYGKGWVVRNIKKWYEDDVFSNTSKAFVTLELAVKYPGDEIFCMPAFGIGGSDRVSVFRSGTDFTDEAFKCALSDAFSFAARHFGLASMVYMNTFDGKYSEKRPEGEEGKAGINPVDVTQYVAPGKAGINDVPTQTVPGKITKEQYDILDKEFHAFDGDKIQWFYKTYKIKDIWELSSYHAQGIIDYKRLMKKGKEN